MTNAPQQPERPRRAFLEPAPRQPFLKTREGRFIALFVVLFVLCSIQLFLSYRKAQEKVQQAAEAQAREAAAAAIPQPTLEERLEQKRAEIPTLFEGALADTSNGDPFLESPGYAKLIETLAKMTPEEVVARTPSYFDDYAKLVEQPDLYRGEFVRVRGLVGGVWANKLQRTVPGVRDVWRGTVATADSSETYLFDLVGDLPPITPQETVVEVHGLIYRTVGYEGQTHIQRVAPYLLARKIRTIEAKSESGNQSTFWAILVGIVVIIGYLLFRSVLRGQRRASEPAPRLRAMFEERQRAKREQQL
ncbi:MAG TPA: hypothetical protein VM509_08135 [Planctomycetota bacterium]|nr:hypothetical protein [Planctomycetota bacterium]